MRIAQDDHPLEQVLELAKVATVAMLKETVHDRCGDREPLPAVELGVFLDEVLDEARDLLDPLAERRHVDPNNVEAVVEVFPEPPLQPCSLEVPVGGPDDPDVYVQRGIFA